MSAATLRRITATVAVAHAGLLCWWAGILLLAFGHKGYQWDLAWFLWGQTGLAVLFVLWQTVRGSVIALNGLGRITYRRIVSGLGTSTVGNSS